ncbi:uncharacterized protein N0V89_009869 [Didymosphaeria variabile]|uniref:Transcription factor domain-containing protein n=1 Tax=Didymosphaeria variabile TaxID=1932322 RepID=A0A9W9C7P0_9PLEO|nr:uncharacterized protein N0V89_009869 [Didymosphaeria variabile]KAJ4348493.1 hypothetical protein N0V89_009869 [Didymosphaeria variabile]
MPRRHAGLAESCAREDTTPCFENPSIAFGEGSQTADGVVQALLQRVAHLEAKLREQGTPQSDHDYQDAAETQSEVDNDTVPPVDGDDCDAATVLEFLAWGRHKDVDFSTAPEHQSGPLQHTLRIDHSSGQAAILTETSTRAQLDFLEALMPNRSHLYQLIRYHNDFVLWYHNSYSSKILLDDLNTFIERYHGSVRYEHLNLQWLALLFAILTGSMTCASSSTLEKWGFSSNEQPTLSQKWYEASVICLNLSNYIEIHTIYSVQAIATLTISAHVIGKSNSQAVLLASAGKIAQTLGLHRLGSESTDLSIEQLRKREAGKRVLTQLCTQDWFQIPFSETYALSSSYSRVVRPLNCNDEDMAIKPLSAPTQTSYCNFRYDIAALMPELLDATNNCNTLYTKYEQVLRFDDKMRKLATASIPTFLSSDAPLHTQGPNYTNWGRRSLTICAAHKIIMIHRKFVGLSFTNSAFAFTRRTCLAAAKTILREALAVPDKHGPVIWIEQAFTIAAGIILSLDSVHRAPSEREFKEHKQLVADAIGYLRAFSHSKIAMRGVQLLFFLQQKLGKTVSDGSKKRHRPLGGEAPELPRKRQRALNMQAFIKDASQNLGVTSPPPPVAEEALVIEDDSWDSFMDLLGTHAGFEGEYLFENFYTT